MAGAGAIAYIIGEGLTDAAAAEQNTETQVDWLHARTGLFVEAGSEFFQSCDLRINQDKKP